MRIFHTEKFFKKLKRLPRGIQELYKVNEEIFFANWKDSRLHTKKLKGGSAPFSFRVTQKYRVLFRLLDENSVLFVSIGHRKDIYD